MTNTTQHPSVADDAKLREKLLKFVSAGFGIDDNAADACREVYAHIDTVLAAAREEADKRALSLCEANAELHKYADEQKERAEKAEAALAAAQQPAQGWTEEDQHEQEYFDRWPQREQAQPPAQAEERQQIPDGWQLVPKEPTEEMWGGIARSIVMAWRFNNWTPRKMAEFMEDSGHDVPDWLKSEPEMGSSYHTISKGTCAVLLYKAMLAAAPAAPQQEG